MNQIYMLKERPGVVFAKRILQVATGVVDLQNPMKSNPTVWLQLDGENEVRIMSIGFEPADNVLPFRPVAGDYWVSHRTEDNKDQNQVISKSEFELLYAPLGGWRRPKT